MESLDTLNTLFEEELKDMYDAELQVMEALPKMIEGAQSTQLRDKFQRHLEQTRKQIERLEAVFEMLDMEPEAEECDGMKGIISDGEKMLEREGDPKVKDAALIAAAQKVEHYEITSYGTLRTFAETLGLEDVAKKLETTLKEEYRTDELLTNFAERSVNKSAPQEQ